MPGSVVEQGAAAERIRRACIALFRQRGYQQTSVRAIAAAAGLEAGSLYHHYPSKQHILLDIFERTMDDILHGLETILGGGGGHEERVCAMVRFHVLFHVERQDEAYISHSELRSLTDANRRRIGRKRELYEGTLRAFLVDGVERGMFEVEDPALTAIAVLTLCSSVSDWFSEGGRLSAEAVAEAYAQMVLRLLRSTRRPASAGPAPGDTWSPGADS